MQLPFLRNFIKIAGPKERIQQFKIKDKALQLFLYRYDSKIKWGGYNVETVDENGETKYVQKPIKSEADINEFIKTQLLQDLYDRLDKDNDDSVYMKRFDVEKNYNDAVARMIFDPQLTEAYRLHQISKEEGEKYYLDIINNAKESQFRPWKEYLEQTHADNPAFQYLIFSQIVNSSDQNTKNAPISANPAAIAALKTKIDNVKLVYDGPIKDAKVMKEINKGIKEGFSAEEISEKVQLPAEQIQDYIDQVTSKDINVLNTYDKELKDHLLQVGISKTGKDFKGAGWLHIPSGKKTTKEEFEENLQTLRDFSIPNNWCTGRGMEFSYLGGGDFYLWISEGKAECAIRYSGEQIAEYEGPFHQVPEKNYKEILKFTRNKLQEYKQEQSRKNRDITDDQARQELIGLGARERYSRLEQQERLNKSFDNAEDVEDFCKHLEEKPELYDKVSEDDLKPAVKRKFRSAVTEGWLKKINAITGVDAMQIAEKITNQGSTIPPFVLEDPRTIESVHGRVAIIYQNAPQQVRQVLQKFPNHWTIYPQGKQIFKDAVVRQYREGLYWTANAFGVTRKTKQQKDRIKSAKIVMDATLQALGDFMPEALQDLEFTAAIDNAKQESIMPSIQNGYVSAEMPADSMDIYLTDPNNLINLADQIANKINTAHQQKGSRADELDIFKDSFMNSEIRALAPRSMRNSDGFRQLTIRIKKKVLKDNIDKFKYFDQMYKDMDEIYQLYKTHILNGNVMRLYRAHGDAYFDDKLLNDPDFKSVIAGRDYSPEKAINDIKFNPSIFLQLTNNLQQNPQIQEAYIKFRVLTPYKASSQKLGKEFNNLPANMKADPRVIKKYHEAVLIGLKAMPGTANYLTCDELDAIAFDSDEIIAACEEKRRKRAKISSFTWYKKAINYFI